MLNEFDIKLVIREPRSSRDLNTRSELAEHVDFASRILYRFDDLDMTLALELFQATSHDRLVKVRPSLQCFGPDSCRQNTRRSQESAADA